ncbi:MAG TPA: hypothetical protein VHV83_08325 [Armatimonadota bacterium]|nr:hypothetical protein [Armatimonadota bacterium]
MVNVVCINCGDKHPDIYVDRLFSTTTKNLSYPFEFYCITDRPRPLRPEIKQIDCSNWGVSGWFTKIKIFDADALPFDNFLFMDISMIVLKDLEPLIDFAQGKDLVAMRDWHYNCFGSCTMWVQKSELVQTIWDEYAQGKEYTDLYLHGDQDYIDAVLREKQLEDQVHYFPQEWFASYKRLLKTHRTAPAEADKMLSDARILKFHGHPRPHQLLNPWLRFRHLTLRYPRYAFHDWTFLIEEVRHWWI